MLVETLFARQPIFDRSRRACGYELLYRSKPSYRSVDGIGATAQVLANAFADIDSPDLLGGLPAFVNLPRDMIVARSIIGFPPHRVVVEVLEDVEADTEVVAALTELRSIGYRIALDDFVPNDHRRPLVPLADIVKVDLVATPAVRLADVATSLRSSGVTLLAEKVETPEDHQRCFDMGFSMFQGFFFARPELISGRRVDEGRQRLASLLGELHRDGVSMQQVAESVERHPDFAHQLLRLLNSAAVGLAREVDSIRQAVVMTGLRRVTEFATVLALASNEQKPQELLTLALTRAKMCAGLASRMGRADSDSFFTVGVLSVLDALTDHPLEDLVASLPLSEDVKSALVDRLGLKGRLLDAAIAYERAEWDRLDQLDLDPVALSEGYVEALTWSSSMASAV